MAPTAYTEQSVASMTPSADTIGRASDRRDALDAEDSGSELEEDDFVEHFGDSDGDHEDGPGRVEDADWELARGDFTKMFNRSRQLAQVGEGQSAPGSKANLTPLPAMNKGRHSKAAPKVPASSGGETSRRRNHQRRAEGSSISDGRAPADKTEEQLSQLQAQFSSRMQLDSTYDPSTIAGGAVNGHVPRKGHVGTSERRVRDKSDRSTVQQVLDPRTLVILFKMLQKGLLKQVNGVISTGKEANVYHASTYKHLTTSEMVADGSAEEEEEGIPLALKIYKTTVMVFKDRDRYITGEFRFRHGYARHNPRKMVKLWAEKEARNLKRLVGAGIRCPRPLELRDHVLVIEFLQDSTGRNSPRLRDAEALIDARRDAGEEDIWAELYVEILAVMRTMFHQCHLVHADLSEYNVLYHQDHLFIIDVSQSVEHDHPYAFDFLRADIQHVDDYFSKKGEVRTLGLRRTFEWILRPSRRLEEGERVESETGSQIAKKESPTAQSRAMNTLDTLASGPFAKFEMITRGPGESDSEIQAELRHMLTDAEQEDEHQASGIVGAHEDGTADTSAQQDEAVFRQAYIPQTLEDVFDPERDIAKRNEGNSEDLIYSNVIGVGSAQRQGEEISADPTSVQQQGTASSDSSDSAEGSDTSESDGEGGLRTTEKKPRGHRHEDRDAKKERKKQTKEAARERRKTKMPKAEKKRRMRQSHK